MVQIDAQVAEIDGAVWAKKMKSAGYSPRPLRTELYSGGTKLRDWLLQNKDVAPSATQRLLMNWNAYWFEKHLNQSESELKPSYEAIDNAVFIVGLWRTASTYLHQRIQQETHWLTPNNWQCFHPAAFSLLPKPNSAKKMYRPMDRTQVMSSSPQEDEFASLLLGENSVYRSFLDPSRILEMLPLLEDWRSKEQAPDLLSQHWEKFLLRIIGSAKNQRLLIKSPNHTYRLPWLANRFPKSTFIWIHRNTDDVIASLRIMWSRMSEVHGATPLNQVHLETFLECAIENHSAIYQQMKKKIPNRIVDVPFSTAVDPKANIKALLNRT